MDPFEDTNPELASTLITMDFGQDGRIQRLWATDPALPEEGESFQFVLPPIQFGEEGADDYYPGTILLGVRSDPREPWVLSRNQSARTTVDPEIGFLLPHNTIDFVYEFPFVEGLEVTGTFYEHADIIPQIVWEIEIRNVGRKIIEIGELGFPLAFNNMYDGFGWNDEQLKKLWQSRVYIHKFIGGAASWVFAQRMTAESPGLLVFPGHNTSWEFYNHVRGSLNTPHQWEGIPVVYIHSKATIEREEWPTWANEHTSLILEPGDSRKFQIRFAAADSDKHDGVQSTLATCNRPTIRVLPSAVAPVDVGIGVEVAGVPVTEFFVSREAETQVDYDETGGFCFVKPHEPGPLTVSFKDQEGQLCHAHLMFTDTIESLIKCRAEWIARNQVVNEPSSPLHKAIVAAELRQIFEVPNLVLNATDYAEPNGLEYSLGDALFLAEKNAIYPEQGQIKIIDEYIETFLLGRVQNPSNGAVASILLDGIPAYFGRPMSYPHVANLYHSAYRIAKSYGALSRIPREYLKMATQTVDAMFEHGWRLYVRSVGVLGFARIYDLLADLESEGLREDAATVRKWLDFKTGELMELKYPFAGESVMDTSGFEEIAAAGRYQDDDDHLERTIRCAFAARSLAASWWWYGSDKRHGDFGETTSRRALVDRGEACLAHTTIPNSLIFFDLMDRDYLALPDAYVRMAFGGMLGPWALIRPDGAASMCYCPDLSSRNAGYNLFTGASGLGYYHYLRGAASYVLPNREPDGYSFGCHHRVEQNMHVVRPWDGIGRRIIMRQIGAEFELSTGCFKELRLDVLLRWFEAEVHNPSDRRVSTILCAKGLWGTTLQIEDASIDSESGVFRLPIELQPNERLKFRATIE